MTSWNRSRMRPEVRISFAEYERLVAASASRLEYHDGAIRRMESPSMPHETIVTNLSDLLAPGVRRARCRKFTNATIVTRDGRYGYRPDLAVSCDAADLGPGEHQRACRLQAPSLIVEVLSRSTATLDLGDKVLVYTRLASLASYLVIDSRRRWAVAYRRDAAGAIGPMEEIAASFETAYGTLSLDEFYDGVDVASLTPLE